MSTLTVAPTGALRDLVRTWPPAVASLMDALTPYGELPETLAMTPKLRSGLSAAADSLDALLHHPGMTPSNKAERTAAISLVLSFFPTYGIDAAGAAAVINGHLYVTEEFPTWSIVEACDRWAKGLAVGAGSGASAPTPPQLRRAVEEVLEIVRGKAITLRKLAMVRNERTPTEEERARVADLIKWRPMAQDGNAARQNDAQDDRGGNGAPSSGNSDEKG